MRNGKGWVYMMDDRKEWQVAEDSWSVTEWHRWGWYTIIKQSHSTAQFFGPRSACCLSWLRSRPRATLPENISTGAYFLYPAEQRTSMWFWNSHVYPSNPYQYSVTCMWISGPYLTRGTRSLWKRIPNVTVHKHALLLQEAWGPQAAPRSTNDFHESLGLSRYNSNPVCLCC